MGLANLFSRKKNEPTELEKKIQFLKAFCKLWADFFEDFFSESLEGKTIDPQDEEAFFKTMTVLATRTFELKARLEKEFKDPERIINYLAQIVSLANLQTMSEAEFSSMQTRWHEIFISLNKSMGKLLQQLPVDSQGMRKDSPFSRAA
ncbi:MAG: hypothetical protein BWZ10_00926 [candidate division BRC1 bacterium ADurb.BinA364]|nr:MAG: hypothetical protein BWZ10_00926 [candidate division BRC1 bacterium ADurb.BinA364]